MGSRLKQQRGGRRGGQSIEEEEEEGKGKQCEEEEEEEEGFARRSRIPLRPHAPDSVRPAVPIRLKNEDGQE